MVTLFDETPQDAGEVEKLYDRCFSPDRQRLSSYRFRDGVPRIDALCKLARDQDGVLRGAIRFWPVRIARRDALLLGPIAVDRSVQGAGFGVALVTTCLEQAQQMGHERVLLVGDYAYFGRFGFEPLLDVIMPPPTDPARVLGRALRFGAWDGVAGEVQRAVG